MGVRPQETKEGGRKRQVPEVLQILQALLLRKATPVAGTLGGKELSVQDRCGRPGTISHCYPRPSLTYPLKELSEQC